MSRHIRIEPESQRSEYLPGETIEFELGASQTLQGNTARFEFLLQLGSGDAAAVDFGAATTHMSKFAGAWSILKELTVTSTQYGTLDSIQDLGRTITAINALQGGGELALSSHGATTYMAPSDLMAKFICQEKNSEANALKVSLDLSLNGAGLFGQTLPLDKLNGLRITVRLAQATEALASSVANASFRVKKAAIVGEITSLFSPAKLEYTRISTMRSSLDVGRKTISFSRVAAKAARAVILTFNLTSNVAAAASDEFQLQTPTGGVSAAIIRVGGQNNPTAYELKPLAAGVSSEDYPEIIKAVGSAALAGFAGSKSPFYSGSATTDGSQNAPELFAIGGIFPIPQDLSRQPIAVDITSGVVAATPYTAFVHVLSAEAISL